MKIRILLLALLLILCPNITACSGKEYRDDLKCTDLGMELTAALEDGQEYVELDDSHREFYFEDFEEYDDCYTVYSADTNDINEIGIFHAASEDRARELANSCEEYIEDMRENSRAFIASYAPEELPKLDGATVRRYGNYVVYTVLPEDKTQTAFETVENMLGR